MEENKDTHEKRDANPIALVFKWAGRHRKYLVASVACATLSGLMVAVPYLAVSDVMRAVYLKTCTAELIAGDVGMLVVGVVLRFILFGLAGTLSHKGAYGALFDVRCRILERLSRAPLGEMDERSTGRIKTVLSDDVENLELLLAHNLPEAFMYASGPVATLIFLLTANVALALATLVPVAAALAVLASLFKIMGSIMGRATGLSGLLSVPSRYRALAARLFALWLMGAAALALAMVVFVVPFVLAGRQVLGPDAWTLAALGLSLGSAPIYLILYAIALRWGRNAAISAGAVGLMLAFFSLGGLAHGLMTGELTAAGANAFSYLPTSWAARLGSLPVELSIAAGPAGSAAAATRVASAIGPTVGLCVSVTFLLLGAMAAWIFRFEPARRGE